LRFPGDLPVIGRRSPRERSAAKLIDWCAFSEGADAIPVRDVTCPEQLAVAPARGGERGSEIVLPAECGE
jgi:hypothetical protein